jgi:hypothetical protein
MVTIIDEKGNERKVDGFIHSISIGGKTYALRAAVIAVKPIVCPKCGGTVTLKYGEGKCDFCGVQYTSKFELVENSAVKEKEL